MNQVRTAAQKFGSQMTCVMVEIEKFNSGGGTKTKRLFEFRLKALPCRALTSMRIWSKVRREKKECVKQKDRRAEGVQETECKPWFEYEHTAV